MTPRVTSANAAHLLTAATALVTGLALLAAGCAVDEGRRGGVTIPGAADGFGDGETVVCRADPGALRDVPGESALELFGLEEGVLVQYRDAALYAPGETSARDAMVSGVRSLFLFIGSVDEARALLRENPSVWNEVLGYEDPRGFGPVDETITCEEGAPPESARIGMLEQAVETCAYDRGLGQNPLGGRAFVQVYDLDGSVLFTYEQLPGSMVAGDVDATLSVDRELILDGVSLDEARAYLREDARLYSRLVGYEDDEGFAPVDDVLSCDSDEGCIAAGHLEAGERAKIHPELGAWLIAPFGVMPSLYHFRTEAEVTNWLVNEMDAPYYTETIATIAAGGLCTLQTGDPGFSCDYEDVPTYPFADVGCFIADEPQPRVRALLEEIAPLEYREVTDEQRAAATATDEAIQTQVTVTAYDAQLSYAEIDGETYLLVLDLDIYTCGD